MAKLSEEGAKFLAHVEGTILNVYDDAAGIPTVCTGHVVQPSDKDWLADGVTMDECLLALQRDVSRFERCVTRVCSRVALHERMADALISLAFNIGEKAFEDSSVVRYLLQRNFPAAAEAFLMWRFANVRMSNGSYHRKPILLGRRMAERTMFISGCFAQKGAETASPIADALSVADLLEKAALATMFDLRDLIDWNGEELMNPDMVGGRLIAIPSLYEESYVA